MSFQNSKRGKWSADHKPKFSFTKSYISFINNSSSTNYVNKYGQGKAFVPYAKAPVHKCPIWEKNNVVRGNTSNVVSKNVTIDAENPDESKKYAYRNDYKGNNPMTHSQWRRDQRSKKGIAARANDKAVNVEEKLVESVKKSVKERLSLPPVEGNTVGDDEMDSDFMDS